MPPSAWMGSAITAQVRSLIMVRAASASPKGMKRTSDRSGPKPSRYLAWPVTDSAPMVRPWKLPSNEINSTRLGWLRTTI